MKFFKRTRGESLLEVMVATVLLSSVLISTFAILQRAVATNTSVRDQVVALNMAREGMEGVRNIRDTNWLKYSGDRRGKWLCADSSGTLNACNGAINTLASGYYIIDFDTVNNRYYLTSGPNYELNLALTQSNQTNYQLENDGDRFTHSGTNTTIFYRQIELEVANPYEGTAPGFCDIDDLECKDARLKITVRVQWLDGGNLRQSNLEGHLFDFFERDTY